jgi:hypothetical protein
VPRTIRDVAKDCINSRRADWLVPWTPADEAEALSYLKDAPWPSNDGPMAIHLAMEAISQVMLHIEKKYTVGNC